MKVLLIVPIRSPKTGFWILPPLGLGFISTSLKKAGFESDIIHCQLKKFSLNDIHNFLNDNKPDIIGISIYSLDLFLLEKLLEVIKKVDKKIITVLGGPHPTSMPGDILSTYENIDYEICGEGEIAFKSLLEVISNAGKPDSISNVSFRKDNKITINEKIFIKDLMEVGIPDWKSLKPEEFPQVPFTFFSKGLKFTTISISRGCPYNCSFCAKVMGQKVRYRPLELVREEISLLYRDYKIKEFFIVDDCFTADNEYVIDFCKMILQKCPQKFYFNCFNGVKIQTLNYEMLSYMKKAGFYFISIGIESGSERTQRNMNKILPNELLKEKIELIKKAGINLYGFFIIGYPTENENDIRETIKLSLSLNIDGANFSCFQPLPGTEIYKKIFNNTNLSIKDKILLYHRTFSDISIATKELNIKSLKKFHRTALIKFYFRFFMILKILSYLKNPRHFKFLIKRGLKYLS